MKSIIFNQHQVNHALKNKEGMFRVVCKKTKNEGGLLLSEAPYQIGQEIFVKESFCHDPRRGVNVTYKQELLTHNLPKEFMPSWKPAQHMKQEHSRLTLRIKSVKVERLRDISEEDAIKEGFKAEYWLINTPDCYEHDGITAVEDFAGWWDETHKKPEEKFDASPWVFAYEYEVVR